MIYIISGLILLSFLFYIFRKQNLKPVKRTPTEICNLLESWINNEIDWKEWDYFESCIIENTKLESIRLQCIEMDYRGSKYLDRSEDNMSVLSEEGLVLVKQLLEECKVIHEST